MEGFETIANVRASPSVSEPVSVMFTAESSSVDTDWSFATGATARTNPMVANKVNRNNALIAPDLSE